jgi:hypothetical protein
MELAEAGATTIRDRFRRKNAVTLKHQRAIYTEKLTPSIFYEVDQLGV